MQHVVQRTFSPAVAVDVTLGPTDGDVTGIRRATSKANILGCLDVPTGGIYRFRGVDVGTLSHE